MIPLDPADYEPIKPARSGEAVAAGPVLLLWRSGDLPRDLRLPGPGITVPDARGM